MQDLWRLSAHRPRDPDQDEKDFGQGGRDRGAGAARCGQPRHQRRGRSQAAGGAGAGRCDRCGDRAGRGGRLAGGRAGHGEGQYRPGGIRQHQRAENPARRHRRNQQPGDRQSAQGGRRDPRPHQLPGVFLSLVHDQPDPWRHQKPARSRYHAGRLVRRRGGGGRGRHRPYRARHRYCGLDPLSGLCLRRAWPAADGRARRRLQCLAARAHHRAAELGGVGPAGAHHRRSSDRASCDVGQGRARSLVGAGAAGRACHAEARRAVSCSRTAWKPRRK